MRALACEGFPGHFSVHGLMGRFWGTQGALALADKVIGAALMYPSILLHQGLIDGALAASLYQDHGGDGSCF